MAAADRGAGPVGVVRKLGPHSCPFPAFEWMMMACCGLRRTPPLSIGRTASYYGNFAVLVRAYAYIIMLGREGLLRVSEQAVLNANYLKERLKEYYELPYDVPCMHECVLSASRQLVNGVRALDIAKYLIQRGIHPPTIYFPLIVKEALMIEPTETESKAVLDHFVDVMIEAARLAMENPRELHEAPRNMPVTAAG